VTTISALCRMRVRPTPLRSFMPTSPHPRTMRVLAGVRYRSLKGGAATELMARSARTAHFAEQSRSGGRRVAKTNPNKKIQ
jgi:hypothetical protein